MIERAPATSDWVVVDRRVRDGEVYAWDVHLNVEDPTHEMLPPEAWGGWPNAKRLSDWYNFIHRKDVRRRMRGMTAIATDLNTSFRNKDIAQAARILSAMIVKAPDECHVAHELDWSPSGVVWKDGKPWVTIKPEELTGWDIPWPKSVATWA